ncbi:MAG: hypothetical protein ACMUHB_03830 [Thermoplasmatota archaeon]
MNRIFLSAAASILLLSVIIIPASAQNEVMEYTDPDKDWIRYGTETGREDDVDIISLSCDDSTFPVVITLTVRGTITRSYGEDVGSNKYVIAIDLDGDESKGEIGLQLSGDQGMTIQTDERIIPYSQDKYTIQGSMLTVRIDYAYFGNYEKVSDFTGSTLQYFNNTQSSVSDSVNYIFGGDNKPYDRTPPDDDITTDDDVSDDDTTDDDTADDDSSDDDSPAPSFLVISVAILSAVLFLGRLRRR